jgi:release factor glutamine methyltransferase
MLLPSKNTFEALRQLFREHLQSIYEISEIDVLFRIVVEDKLGVKWKQLMLSERFSESDINLVSPALEALIDGKPLQYILGNTEFFECKLKVDSRVLIPRPETEELCDLIIGENSKLSALSVLDIGTGSGCIPIALKHHAPKWELYAVDIDANALQLAEENAKLNNTIVHFSRLDVLQTTTLEGEFDIVISNPPYIAESEKTIIHKNVLDNEPHLALFVPNADALLFYRKITKLAVQSLKKGGKLYFEINERFGNETMALLVDSGFQNCRIIKDLSGKERFVVGQLMVAP